MKICLGKITIFERPMTSTVNHTDLTKTEQYTVCFIVFVYFSKYDGSSLSRFAVIFVISLINLSANRAKVSSNT